MSNPAQAAPVEVHAEVTPARDSAAPPLVFANAIGTNLHIWDAVVPALTWPGAVIRYDKRGHGRSPTPPSPYTLDDHVTDLAALLDRHVAQPAIVCGLSVGGLIAQGLAVHHPATVTALILCDTAPKIGTPEMWHQRSDAITADGMAPHVDAILARWFSPAWAAAHADTVDHWRQILLTTSVTGYTATCAAIAGADLRESITAVDQPMLMICGGADIATPPGPMREFAQTVKNGQFQEIPGAGHLPCIDNPLAFAAAVSAFIAPLCADPQEPR